MKQFKIKNKDKNYIVIASSNVDAVKKLKDKNRINDALEKIDSYKKVGIWKDESGYLFADLSESQSGKRLYRLGTKDMKKAINIIKDQLSFLLDCNSVKVSTRDSDVVSEWVKNSVVSSIIKHGRGYTFYSAIVREDRDFDSLDEAEQYAKSLGYIKRKNILNDSVKNYVVNISYYNYGLRDWVKGERFETLDDADRYCQNEIKKIYRNGYYINSAFITFKNGNNIVRMYVDNGSEKNYKRDYRFNDHSSLEDIRDNRISSSKISIQTEGTAGLRDVDGRDLPQSAKELKEELGLARKVIGSHSSKGIRAYQPRQNQFNNSDVAEINEAINDAIKNLDQGFGEDSYKRLELDLNRIKQTMPRDTSSDEYKVLNKVLAKGTKALNAIKEYLKKRDSSIKDYDYIGNAMIMKSLPKIGEMAGKYGFGYSDSVIVDIKKTGSKDGHNIYTIYCVDKDELDRYKQGISGAYHYTAAIRDSYKNYRGYDIEYNLYGKKEFTVQYRGDDVWFKTEKEAKDFIDEITNNKVKDARRINYDDDLIKVYLNGKEVFRGYAEDWCDDDFDRNFKWTGSQYESTNSEGKWVVKVVDKSVFSEETMNSVQEGIEEDYESMSKRLSGLHDGSSVFDGRVGDRVRDKNTGEIWTIKKIYQIDNYDYVQIEKDGRIRKLRLFADKNSPQDASRYLLLD